MICLKLIANPKWASAFLSILMDVSHPFWTPVMKKESFIKMLGITDIGLVKRKRPKLQPKKELNAKKVLSVWWDCKGVINFELQPTNVTINAKIYSQ